MCVVLCVCSTFFGPFDDVPCEFQASMHADTIIYPYPSGSFDVLRSGLARLKFQLQAPMHTYALCNYVFISNVHKSCGISILLSAVSNHISPPPQEHFISLSLPISLFPSLSLSVSPSPSSYFVRAHCLSFLLPLSLLHHLVCSSLLADTQLGIPGAFS